MSLSNKLALRKFIVDLLVLLVFYMLNNVNSFGAFIFKL